MEMLWIGLLILALSIMALRARHARRPMLDSDSSPSPVLAPAPKSKSDATSDKRTISARALHLRFQNEFQREFHNNNLMDDFDDSASFVRSILPTIRPIIRTYPSTSPILRHFFDGRVSLINLDQSQPDQGTCAVMICVTVPELEEESDAKSPRSFPVGFKKSSSQHFVAISQEKPFVFSKTFASMDENEILIHAPVVDSYERATFSPSASLDARSGHSESRAARQGRPMNLITIRVPLPLLR